MAKLWSLLIVLPLVVLTTAAMVLVGGAIALF
jgi:hypothetical protein